MQPSHDDIQEFRRIYREEFGEELADADAERRARQLLTFYEIIFQILVKHQEGQPACGSPAVDLETPRGIVHDASPNLDSIANLAASESAEATPSQNDAHRPPSS